MKRASFYFKIIFGLGLIIFLLYKIPFSQTIQALKDASIMLVFIAIFITGVAVVASAFKLQILARLKNEKITLRSVIKAYYIGFFFNNFMPTDIGGDIFKISELKKNNLELRDATQAVIIERLAGVFALTILALFLAMPGVGMFRKFGMAWIERPFLILVLILFIISVIGYMAWESFLKPYLKERKTHLVWGKIYRVIEGLYVYGDNPKILFQAFFISLSFHFLGAIIFLTLTASIGNVLPFASLLMVIPIVSFVSLLPVSVGALGVKEGALVFCLTKLGLDAPAALGVTLLFRLSIYIHSSIGGLLYTIRRNRT